MGSGIYCSTTASIRSEESGYHTKSTREIFTAQKINNDMDPKDIVVRESRDSDEHPESLAIILGLDVTGSMGHIPHQLIKEGLTQIMGAIIQAGERDPQVLFTAVGDHECDNSPLQVGQFESSDELLDKWLKQVYLEGGGGGNDGESYLLAWYFAAMKTSIDCFEKRGQKGFLFTIGDEKTLKNIPSSTQKRIFGVGQYSDMSASELLNAAMEKYNVYHVHVRETHQGMRQQNIDDWKQLMGDNLIVVDRSPDIAKVIARTIIENKIVAKKDTDELREGTITETESML